MPKTLGLEEIAKLWRCTRRRARDVIVKAPGFPPCVPCSKRGNPLWLEEAVYEYMRREG